MNVRATVQRTTVQTITHQIVTYSIAMRFTMTLYNVSDPTQDVNNAQGS